MKHSRCPAKEKARARKTKRMEEGKRKVINSHESLLSAHFQTAVADIWHLEQKVLEGRKVLDLQTAFWSLWLCKMVPLALKCVFGAKFPGANGFHLRRSFKLKQNTGLL